MPPNRRQLAVGLTVMVVTLAAAGVYFLQGLGKAQAANSRTRAILDQFSAPGMEHADAENCRECHEEAYMGWKDSHHALANAPLQDRDLNWLSAPPEGLLEERGMDWHTRGFPPVLEEAGLPRFPVVGTIGLTPLIQFLILAEDGRIQAHDVAWDVEKEEWFSVFERDDIEPRIPGEWGHWTGQGMNWDANCAYCHMTEYHKAYDPETNTYDRHWAAMGITCAQCHPGMETHLAQIRNGNNDFKESLTPVQVMEYCATCHSRREELTAERFKVGDEFEDHYQLTLASAPGIYHPDGQVIGENYVYGSLTMSKMGHAGITCMDCHDPHTNGHILPFENNALCQRCHGTGLKDAPVINPLSHSRHPANSTGNQCVECHMPVTHFMGRDGRRDHSFSNPDPQLTIEMGIPNACNGCHNTYSSEWSLEYTDKWYGPDMNADRRAKARLMHALFEGQSGMAGRLRAAIEAEKNRFWKATFVSMLQYVPPEPESLQVLVEASRHPDPMVRSAAVRTGMLESFPTADRQRLLGDPSRSVRLTASISSQAFPVAGDEAERELEAYLRQTADSPSGALRYAAYLQSREDMEKSAAIARQATTFEPVNPEVWRVAAVQLHGLGHSEEALGHLETALGLEPGNPSVLFNLGLLHYETGATGKAFSNLNAAVEADPRFEAAWYNLIVLYWQSGNVETAQEKLRQALVHLPQSQRLQQLAGQLR